MSRMNARRVTQDTVAQLAHVRHGPTGLFPTSGDGQSAESGFITTTARDGSERRHPLPSLSLGIATTSARQFTSVHEIAAAASEVKTAAKGEPGSDMAR